jgi:hypothetical protein
MASEQDKSNKYTPVVMSAQQAHMLGLQAVSARFEQHTRKLVVTLFSGVRLEIPVGLIESLHQASVTALRDIELSPSGLGLHFPKLDADVLVVGLLQGVMGSPAWMEGIDEHIARVKAAEKHRAVQVKTNEKTLSARVLTNVAPRTPASAKGKLKVQRIPEDDLKVAAKRTSTPPKNKTKR